jgi:lipid kinase YegS
MPTGKTFDLIIHGARAELPELRTMVGWMRDRGHRVRPRVTWEAGDAERFALEGARAGVDAVIAVGGDGTVNEVVNGLSGLDTPLGIVPAGTANDFARQVGIPDDVHAAMDVILSTEPTRVDTGELNGKRFLNVSSAGIAAETTSETSSAAKAVLGPLAYAITGVRKLAELEARRARFVGPGFDHDGEYLLFTVGNGRATGAGTVVAPLASVTDGLLDVCLVEPMARSEFAALLLQIKRGGHLENSGVRYVQTPYLRVESDEPVSVNIDGEPYTFATLDYRARPADLLVHVAHLPGDDESR